jgi:predicted PurR-regulated permease PerM
MTFEKRTMFWVAGLAVFAYVVHLLSSILLPFVAGMLTAYFLDPVADRLEARKIPRGIATALILLAFFLCGAGVITLLFPMLQRQIVDLAILLPGMVDAARQSIEPILREFLAGLPPDTMAEIKTSVGNIAGKVASWVTGMLASVWSGGVALFNMISLVVVTPVVAFYLLRDWDLITVKIDSWLPLGARPTIRDQLGEIDLTLAAFVRGQATVCLVLALVYGIGLSIVGLKSGLLVGLGAGLISFIPYLGAATGLTIGVGIALFQFDDFITIATVAGIFLFGQTLESYVLTPRLVGDKVGLHPVWIIFALMAGGALFGFTGILLAVPVAAVIGVLSRFAIKRYLDSPLYHGGRPES